MTEQTLLLPPYPPQIGKPGRSTLNRTASTQSEIQATTVALGETVRINYGRVRVGGKRIAIGISGNSLVLGFAFGAGKIDGYEAVWINDYRLPDVAGENVNSPHAVRLNLYDGSPDQGVDPWLQSAISGYADTNVWDDVLGAHYVVARIPASSTTVTSWPSSIIMQLRGQQVLDPRENAALHSNDLSNAAWTDGSGGAMNLTTNQPLTGDDAGGGPYGRGAQLWTMGSAAAGSQYFGQTVGQLAADNTAYAIVKAGSGAGVGLSIHDATAGTHHRAWFTWAAGVLSVESTENGATAEVIPLWDGWYVAVVHYSAPTGEQGNTRGLYVWIEKSGSETTSSNLWLAGVGIESQPEYHGIAHTTDTAVSRGTRFSDNPSLCLADFRSNSYYGCGKAVNWPSVGRCATWNDRMIGSPPEVHRTIGLTIDKRRSKDDWTQTLRAYAGCAVVPIDGEDHLIPDYKAPVSGSVGIGDVLSGTLQVDRGGAAGMPNVVTINYTDTGAYPGAGVEKWTDGVATFVADAVKNGTEPRRESRVSLPGIQRYGQAMREAVERYRMLQRDLRVRHRMLGKAIDKNIMDVLSFTHPFGLTAKPLRVADTRIVRPGEFDITYTEYSDSLYDDSLYELPDHGYTGLPDPNDVPSVVGLSVTEHMESVGGNVITRLVVSWNETDYLYVSGYQMQILDAAGTVLHDQQTDELTLTSGPVLDGATYTVRARVLSAVGISGPWAEVTHTVVGSTARPGDVPWARAAVSAGVARITWGDVDGDDVTGYDVRLSHGVTASWSAAEPVSENSRQPVFISGIDPRYLYTVMVKARNIAGNLSDVAASAQLYAGDPVPGNIVLKTDHHADGFPGERENFNRDVVSGDLVADAGSVIKMWTDDAAGMWLSDGQDMWSGAQYLQARYTFVITAPEVPAGSTMTVAREVAPDGYTLEYRQDGAGKMWGDSADSMWTTSGASFWQQAPWEPWPGLINPVSGLRYAFRLTTPGGLTRGVVSALSVDIDVPDIQYTFNDLTIPAGGRFIDVNQPFTELIAVSLTLQGDDDAVTARVISKTKSGALVECRDAAGNPTTGVVDAIFRGY